MADTATKAAAAAPAIPFSIAARQQDRFSFSPNVPASLAATAATPLTPIEVPATGFLRGILVEIAATISGGTPQVTADAPFNMISSIGVRSPEGTPLIVPVTGYQLFLINKYGGQTWMGANADPRVGYDFTYTVASAIHFFLWLPFEIDKSTGLGAIPAQSASRNYQVDITLNSIQGVFSATTPPTTVAPTVTAYAFYWTQPAPANSLGQTQVQSPNKLISQWSLETPALTPGDKYVKSNVQGNILRTQIYVMRNSSGARIDTNGLTGFFQFIVNNEVQNYWSVREWEYLMTKWYGFTAARSAGKDVANSLDTGVYVNAFHALEGGEAGDPANSRGQMLTTNSAAQIMLYLNPVGSAGSTLEILTQKITAAPSTAYSK
jgi:hypothetical protein